MTLLSCCLQTSKEIDLQLFARFRTFSPTKYPLDLHFVPRHAQLYTWGIRSDPIPARLIRDLIFWMQEEWARLRCRPYFVDWETNSRYSWTVNMYSVADRNFIFAIAK